MEDINLLPHDLSRKKASKKPKYAAAAPSFFSRLFSASSGSKSKGDKLPSRRLSEGKPLPSALFERIKKEKADDGNEDKKGQALAPKAAGVPAQSVMSMHRPSPKETKEAKEAKKPSQIETSAPVHRISGFDVNLLTQEYTRSFQKTNPLTLLAIWAGLTALAIAFIFAFLHIFEIKAKERLDVAQEINGAISETIETYKALEQEDNVLRVKAEAVRALLDQHVSWKTFLGKLEQETIPEVTYLAISASAALSMNVSAIAKDYTSLARQITVFQSTSWIKGIDVTSAAFAQETATMPSGVSFDMQILMDKQAIYSD